MANAILADQPDAIIHLITDKRFFPQAKKLVAGSKVSVSTVSAGKLRRYANLKWYDHFYHFFVSYIPNVIDAFRIIVGVFQSQIKIIKFRPDVIFIKGGYVGLPVGLAAAKLWPRVPIVLHDSDASPGLTNRILSRYAVKIATALPTKFYQYDAKKVTYVGMPIRPGLEPASLSQKKKLKINLGLDPNTPLVLAMGGGQGSQTVNEAVLENYPVIKGHAQVLLVTGDKNLLGVREVIKQSPRSFIKLRTEGFIAGQQNVDVIRAADIIITRAGATTLAEIARLGTPAIIIPSPYLASDHQTKNAEVFSSSKAALIIHESELIKEGVLSDAVIGLLDDKDKQRELSENLKQLDKPNAATEMAKIIIGVGDGQKK